MASLSFAGTKAMSVGVRVTKFTNIVHDGSGAVRGAVHRIACDGSRCTNTLGVVLIVNCGVSPLGGIIVEGREGGVRYHSRSHRG